MTAPTYAVIDFETTGISPAQGARATEVAAVLLQGSAIVGRYQSLMHTGAWVPPFIEQLTGISNRMLQTAPPAHEVMRAVARFTQGCTLVAHNAAFDRQFWQAELALAGVPAHPAPEFACTLLLSRRLHPQAPDHKLGTLARWHGLPSAGRAHRALADAEVTAHLLARIQEDLRTQFAAELGAAEVSPGLLLAMQRTTRASLPRCVRSHSAPAAQAAKAPQHDQAENASAKSV